MFSKYTSRMKVILVSFHVVASSIMKTCNVSRSFKNSSYSFCKKLFRPQHLIMEFHKELFRAFVSGRDLGKPDSGS